ncbi:hypothetical protein BGZ74_004285 [Mortierella antarctica]|nr:hypothetical protein BGZ74_004285 [Mortierella antarctica]
MSSRESKFILLSEDDLVKVFWKDETLQEQLRVYAHPTISVQDPSQCNVVGWLKNLDPRLLINKLLTDIGGFTMEERKKKKNWSRTDSFWLQLLAFKLNELKCVKYRQLDVERLLDQLTSMLGGMNHYLTEIRNVVKAKEDVERLWKCDPSQIKILGIDLGKAFVIGASASITKYVKESKTVEVELETFYNSIILKKHKWDAQRARDKEFKLIAKRLLKMVSGTPGQKRDEKNKVIIGIGLGEFSSTSQLSSLHSAFAAYFMQLARSLDYIVVGVNEYYTSKRCPVCHEFVGQVDIRQLYCPTSTCRVKIHRDVMAGHNMCNVIQGHLLHQQRPHYLQPFDKDGKHIWQLEERSQSVDSMVARSDVKDVEQPGIEQMALEEEETGPGRRKRPAA